MKLYAQSSKSLVLAFDEGLQPYELCKDLGMGLVQLHLLE